MSRLLYRLGGSAARHPWRTISVWAVAIMVVMGLAGTVGGALNDDYTIPGRDSQQAYDLLSERFPEMAGADARVVVHADEGRVDQAAARPSRPRAGPASTARAPSRPPSSARTARPR